MIIENSALIPIQMWTWAYTGISLLFPFIILRLFLYILNHFPQTFWNPFLIIPSLFDCFAFNFHLVQVYMCTLHLNSLFSSTQVLKHFHLTARSANAYHPLIDALGLSNTYYLLNLLHSSYFVWEPLRRVDAVQFVNSWNTIKIDSYMLSDMNCVPIIFLPVVFKCWHGNDIHIMQ